MSRQCETCQLQLDGFGISTIHPNMPAFLWCRNCGSMMWDGNGYMQTYVPQVIIEEQRRIALKQMEGGDA